MNARIKKDLRALAPMFALTMAGVIGLSILLTGHEAWQIVLTVFAGCCALLSANLFGHEFNSRTITLLLAQPISRRQLWAEKMLVLGAALVSCLGVLIVCERFVIHGEGRAENLIDATGLGVLIVACAFCTSPGLTLTVRNTLMGAATTFGAPVMCFGLLMLLAGLGGKLMGKSEPLFASDFEHHPYAFISLAAMIYCAGYYWFGRHHFMRFEDANGVAKEITLPAKLETRLAALLQRLLPAYANPWASLIRKELMVHRVSFIISGFSTLFAAVACFAWFLYPTDVIGGFTITLWALPVVMVPILTGATMIAEERNWGTLTWQLTLPISSAKQLLVKLLVAICTCLTLAIALPLLLALIGRHLVPSVEWDPVDLFHFGPIFALIFVAMLFGSSISPNGLHAIIVGLGIIIAAGTLIGLSSLGVEAALQKAAVSGWIEPRHLADFLQFLGVERQENAQSHELIAYYLPKSKLTLAAGLSLALLLGVVGWLTYRNFRCPEPEPRVVRSQIAVLLILSCAIAVPVLTLIFWVNGLFS